MVGTVCEYCLVHSSWSGLNMISLVDSACSGLNMSSLVDSSWSGPNVGIVWSALRGWD